MAQSHPKVSKKIPLLALICVVIVAAGTSVIWLRDDSSKTSPFATKSYPAENNFNNTRKASSKPATTLDNGPTSSSSTSSSTDNVSLTITRADVDNQSNALEVGTLVNGTTSGTCTLSVSQAGETTITATNQVTLSNNTYSCPVFSIPLSQFPNLGKWNVSVEIVSGSSNTTSNYTLNPVNLSGGSQ